MRDWKQAQYDADREPGEGGASPFTQALRFTQPQWRQRRTFDFQYSQIVAGIGRTLYPPIATRLFYPGR